MNSKEIYEIEVGKEYEIKSGEKVKVINIHLYVGLMNWYYNVHLSNSNFFTYESHGVHYRPGPVQKFTTHYDFLIPVLNTLSAIGHSQDSEINIKPNFWYAYKTRQGQTVPIERNPVSCSHEWVTTIGFSSEYTDCKLCGVKKEEV